MYSLDTLTEINFELSSFCNAKCPQCHRYDIFGNLQKNLTPAHLSINIIKNLPLKKMVNLKTISLCGNFGDPLMHPELDQILDFFSTKEIKISTNASLRNKEWWEKIGKNKNIQITFCIDGIGEEHELYRRKTSYDKIIDNAKAFIQAGGTAHWQFIVFKHNEHQIDEAKKLSISLGFDKIFFIFSDRFDTSNTWKVFDNNQYLYDLNVATNQTTLRESLDSPIGEKSWKNLYKNKGEISCFWSQKKKIYIHSDGTVYPCCMLGSIQAGQSDKNIEKLLYKRIIKEYKNIDLNFKSLEKIFKSKTFKKNIPESFTGNPLSHPVCIEWCNKNTGKYIKELNYVNKA